MTLLVFPTLLPTLRGPTIAQMKHNFNFTHWKFMEFFSDLFLKNLIFEWTWPMYLWTTWSMKWNWKFQWNAWAKQFHHSVNWSQLFCQMSLNTIWITNGCVKVQFSIKKTAHYGQRIKTFFWSFLVNSSKINLVTDIDSCTFTCSILNSLSAPGVPSHNLDLKGV